jgi:hypothetical protein
LMVVPSMETVSDVNYLAIERGECFLLRSEAGWWG